MPSKKVTKSSKKENKVSSPQSMLQKNAFSTIIHNKKYVAVIVIVLLCLGALMYVFKNQFVVAQVNGVFISRSSFSKELEKEAGRQALDALVTKSLILQEARKQNVSVSDEEITQQLNAIEANLLKQNQKLDDLLAAQGMKRKDLEEQLTLQKLVEKIVGKNLSVTEKEVNEYIERNKDTLPETVAASDEAKTNIKQQLLQQKLNIAFQNWLSQLKKDAKINYF